MTTAPLTTDQRTLRAHGICTRQECELRNDGRWYVRDTQTGSGQWHIVTAATTCDCMDYRRSGLRCKHVLAVIAEQVKLDAYANDWNAAAESMRPRGVACPDCGSETRAEQFYVGGRGYLAFAVCQNNQEHKAVRQ